MWKPLNYQVLLKTRHDSAQVRFAALTVIEKMYAKLEEQLLPLLPETIPFLAELMEDPDQRVEKLCKELTKFIEQFLGGSSISSYL